ncbi:MAG: ATP synthase F1 subunit delta [Acidobacteriia bacterium]|nr:ATP synthase F1 subunit delta [Terriglobia bacterium]
MAAISSRYARAFADVVFSMKIAPASVMQQLYDLASAVKSNEMLQRVWETPAIPAEQKRALLDAIVARENVTKPVRNFLAVLIDHCRIGELAEIARGVESEIDARLGFAEADVTSARELTEPEKRALEGKIETMTGQKVRAHYATDRTILGGAIVRLGSTIYDGSVKGQLHRMKEQLAGE